jgi:hypothetical protein
LSADEFGKTFGSQILTYFPLLDGTIDYNQMLDLQIAQGAGVKQHGGAETMTMLVEIYFPSVRPALNEVWQARDAFAKISIQIKRAWQRDGDLTGGDWKQTYIAATQVINDRIAALQKEIVIAARVHADVKQ